MSQEFHTACHIELEVIRGWVCCVSVTECVWGGVCVGVLCGCDGVYVCVCVYV